MTLLSESTGHVIDMSSAEKVTEGIAKVSLDGDEAPVASGGEGIYTSELRGSDEAGNS